MEEVTQNQMEELAAFLQGQPQIKVTEDGTTETRNLWSKEEMERRGGGETVQGWWNS